MALQRQTDAELLSNNDRAFIRPARARRGGVQREGHWQALRGETGGGGRSGSAQDCR